MELTYYLWLSKKCSKKVMRGLIDEFGSAEAVYHIRDIASLLHISGMSYDYAFQIVTDKELDEFRNMSEYAVENGMGSILYTDRCYPEKLKQIHSAPMFLFYKGANTLADNMPCIAIVGSRKATRYGLEMAGRIASELGGCGINVVSGLALGIDAAAHKGALSCSASTTAVLGCGIDVVYPMSNQSLYGEIIASNGMIISEFFPGTPASSRNFPVRNRIISGLCDGIIVVEASDNSGSLITAHYAAEQGREVFAVPGNVTSEQSSGSNRLIRDGARLIASGKDVIEELYSVFRPIIKNEPVPKASMTDAEEQIYNEIKRGFQTADAIAQKAQKPINAVNSVLTALELKGIIAVEGGIVYILC